MTEYLDRATESARKLQKYLENRTGDEDISEERIEKLTSHVVGSVRQHNDQLAEQEMGW